MTANTPVVERVLAQNRAPLQPLAALLPTLDLGTWEQNFVVFKDETSAVNTLLAVQVAVPPRSAVKFENFTAVLVSGGVGAVSLRVRYGTNVLVIDADTATPPDFPLFFRRRYANMMGAWFYNPSVNEQVFLEVVAEAVAATQQRVKLLVAGKIAPTQTGIPLG